MVKLNRETSDDKSEKSDDNRGKYDLQAVSKAKHASCLSSFTSHENMPHNILNTTLQC